MPGVEAHGYAMAGGESPVDRLYGAATARRPGPLPPAWAGSAAEPHRFLSISGTTLRIAPFLIRRWEQKYISHEAIDIDLGRLPAGLYRIVAVHDFRAEDRNPDLDECLAGVFLARWAGHRWEEAEDHPIECRSLEVLCQLDAAMRRIVAP